MKAQIIRDDIEVSPAFADQEDLQPLIVRKPMMRDGWTQQVPHWRNGAILEFPDCHYLVRQGVAIPADEKCAQRARRTPEQMKKAQYAYERLVRRIDVDDFDIYDAGVITGYDEKGDYIPGPNYARLHEFRPVNGTDDDDEEDETPAPAAVEPVKAPEPAPVAEVPVAEPAIETHAVSEPTPAEEPVAETPAEPAVESTASDEPAAQTKTEDVPAAVPVSEDVKPVEEKEVKSDDANGEAA